MEARLNLVEREAVRLWLKCTGSVRPRAMLHRDRHSRAGWRLQMASATILFDRGGDRAKQGTTKPTGGWLTSILGDVRLRGGQVGRELEKRWQ